jgi:hypothetical protein
MNNKFEFELNHGNVISAKPYICKHEYSYTAYVPYYHKDEECSDMNAYGSALYFDLPTDREDGNPTATYSYSNNVHEIGIACVKLSTIYEKIHLIQIAIKKKDGIVYETDNINDYTIT